MAANLDENPHLSAETARLLLDIPPRVARIETHIEYMRGDIAELKGDVKELRAELKSDIKDVRSDFNELRAEIRTEIKDVRAEIKDVRAEARTDFRLLFSALIAVALGLAGLMAKGFHWVG
jgi:chromosome segregation ATPase